MTTTTPRQAAAKPPAVSARIRRRRPSRLLLIGVVLAVVGALAGVMIYRQADNRVAVVAVAKAIPFGQTINRDDVHEVLLPVDTGLATVPWSEVTSVVGRIAATDLLAGQAITPDAVTSARPPNAGNAVVGIAVGPGRVPVTPLLPRDEVLVVGIADTGAPLRGTVLRAGEPDSAGRRTVDLLVAESSAAELARASASEHAAIVLVSRR